MLSLSEIENVNKVEHIDFHADFHVVWLQYRTVCVYSTLPAEFLEYTVSKESSFRFQGISVSAFCL